MSLGKTPTWRKERAEEYARNSLRISEVSFEKGEDPLVKKLTEYLLVSRAERNLSLSNKRKRFPKIQEAFEIYTREDPFGDKWMIEALALSSKSYKEIAGDVLLPEALVEMYCLCFFDVRQPGVREALVRNLRRLCPSDSCLLFHNYGWKMLVVVHGVEVFSKIVLNRKDMGSAERTILRNMKKNALAINSWWGVEKLSMTPDDVPNEKELSYIRGMIEAEESVDRRESGGHSKNLLDDSFGAIVEVVGAQVGLTDEEGKAEAEEKRL